MEYQSLTKVEILDYARNEKIQLNKHTLDNYIKLGLLKGEKVSLGRTGTLPSRYFRAMESIRLIDRFKSQPYNYRLQDIIYILYWHGLPVRSHILLENLKDFHENVLQSINEAKIDLENPEDSKPYITDQIKEQTQEEYSSSSVGRHTTKTQKEIDIQTKATVDQYMKFVFLKSELISTGAFNISMLTKFIDDPNWARIVNETDLQLLISKLEIFKLDTWMASAPFTNIETEKQLEELIMYIQNYWLIFKNNNSEEGNRMSELLFQFIHPHFYKLLIYLVLASGQALKILTYIAKSSSIEIWKTMCMEYKLSKGGE